MNLARWNHVLLPATKTGRDRFRTGRWRFISGPLLWLYFALSDEGRFLAVFSIIAGASGLDVGRTEMYLVWCGATAILIASLLFRRFFALDGVSVDVEHPDRVGVGETLQVTILLSNRGDRTHRVIRVDGPLLPWDGAYASRTASLSALEPHASGRIDVSLSFSHRGEHHLDPFHVAALVPLGFAVGPALATEGIRFLVLPRLAKLSRLDAPTGVRHQPGGVVLASRTGEAREIVGLRPYRAGDPIRDLNHRAWARLGVPVVREYQQEYFTRFGVVLDTESVGPDDPRLEAAVSLAAGVLAHLSRGEALIDLLVVGDALHRLTLGRSLGFLEQGLDLLAVVEPSDRFDGNRVAALLAPHLSRLSSVVIVALSWDAERQAVRDVVERNGVGCRVLTVDDEMIAAIDRGEALTL